MKSLAVTRPGDLRETDPDKKCIIEILDVDEPQICGPTEVKIKIAYCAICASDPHVAQNCFNREVPYGMGHEISGVIVDMGSEVNTKGLKIGGSSMDLPAPALSWKKIFAPLSWISRTTGFTGSNTSGC